MSEIAKARAVGSEPRRVSKSAVAALCADLRHIMSTRPHTDWPSMAKAVLDHYAQPVDPLLLDQRDKRIQDAAWATLEGLVAGSFQEIQAGIIDLRTNESTAVESECPGEAPAAECKDR
ncbi:MAG: hypothetical protein ACI8TP_002929 [Acidimicrobiales bacterium]|jgi:hypothetical protein